MAAGVRRRNGPVAAGRVVVYVHGFMAAGPVFEPMRRHVAEATDLPGLVYTYLPVASFERAARGLAAFVDRYASKDAQVSLVGHSLGGLVARWYVQELGGERRVDRLVTLATPHGGTHRATGVPLPLTRALSPHGPVVRRLEQRSHVLAGIPHTALVAGRDHLVHPPASAAAVRQGTVVWLDDLGHNEMLYDRRVHDLVADALK